MNTLNNNPSLARISHSTLLPRLFEIPTTTLLQNAICAFSLFQRTSDTRLITIVCDYVNVFEFVLCILQFSKTQ